MKIPGMDKMMERMQAKQAEMQAAMESARHEATAGGGVVAATVNGMKKVISVRIDESLFKDGDREMLQDLLVVAINEAGRKADEAAQQQVMNMMGGFDLGNLKIPGLS